jgi:hypothetical protein
VLNSNIEWKPIAGFEGIYEVSSAGQIRGLKGVLKPYLVNSGYLTVTLYKDGAGKRVTIHRQVAKAFCEGTGDVVNHIDFDKTNNAADNLEWVTTKQNLAHSRDAGRMPYNFPTLGKKLSNTSRYYNVGWDKARSKWKASIRVDGKTVGQKRFDNEIDAAKHVNKLLDDFGLPNRPRNDV